MYIWGRSLAYIMHMTGNLPAKDLPRRSLAGRESGWEPTSRME